MYAASPFRVADIGTNSILLRAEHDLLALARRFGTPQQQETIAARIPRMATAIARQFDAARNLFFSRDLIDDSPIHVGTSAGYLPLWAGAVSRPSSLPSRRASRAGQAMSATCCHPPIRKTRSTNPAATGAPDLVSDELDDRRRVLPARRHVRGRTPPQRHQRPRRRHRLLRIF